MHEFGRYQCQHWTVPAHGHRGTGRTRALDRVDHVESLEPGQVGHVARESDDRRHTRTLDQALWGVERDDPPLVDHGEPVAEVLGLVHEVGDEHDRGAAGADLADQLPRRTSRLGIETLGELVEEHHLGRVDERERDEQSLALATREAVKRLAALALQAPSFDQVVGRHRLVGERAEQLERLRDGETSGQRGVLQSGSDSLTERNDLSARIEAEHAHVAAVVAAQSLDELDAGGLAGTVRSEDAEDLALVDPERDVVDRDEIAVPLAQTLDGDDRRTSVTRREAPAAIDWQWRPLGAMSRSGSAELPNDPHTEEPEGRHHSGDDHASPRPTLIVIGPMLGSDIEVSPRTGSAEHEDRDPHRVQQCRRSTEPHRRSTVMGVAGHPPTHRREHRCDVDGHLHDRQRDDPPLQDGSRPRQEEYGSVHENGCSAEQQRWSDARGLGRCSGSDLNGPAHAAQPARAQRAEAAGRDEDDWNSDLLVGCPLGGTRSHRPAAAAHLGRDHLVLGSTAERYS